MGVVLHEGVAVYYGTPRRSGECDALVNLSLHRITGRTARISITKRPRPTMAGSQVPRQSLPAEWQVC